MMRGSLCNEAHLGSALPKYPKKRMLTHQDLESILSIQFNQPSLLTMLELAVSDLPGRAGVDTEAILSLRVSATNLLLPLG